jgi:hypothetical protein
MHTRPIRTTTAALITLSLVVAAVVWARSTVSDGATPHTARCTVTLKRYKAGPMPTVRGHQTFLFGDASIERATYAASKGQLQAIEWSRSTVATVNSVMVYVARGTTATKLDAGIYTSGENARTLRRLTAGSTTLRHKRGWVSVRMKALKVKANHPYWLAVLGRGGRLNLRSRHARVCPMAGGKTSPAKNLPALPTTVTATTPLQSPPFSAYAAGSDVSTDCFASPGACGFPDPAYQNVGATSSCSSLPSVGSVTAGSSGATIQNEEIKGTLTISAANVTVKNVCVVTAGDYDGNGVNIGPNATNTLIENSTVEGSSATGTGVLNTGVFNPNNVNSVALNSVYITNAAEDYHGSGNIQNSYMQAGGFYTIPNGSDGCSTNGGCPAHNEDVYLASGNVTLNHNTLLNSASQTAVLFGDGNQGGAANNRWTVTSNLLAGGGYVAYFQAKTSTVGSSTMNFSNNRIARCLGPTKFDGYGTQCNDATANTAGTSGDKNGYYPNGGYYGGFSYTYCPSNGASQIWANNVWDDNNSVINCPR